MGKLEKIQFLNQRMLVQELSLRCQGCLRSCMGNLLAQRSIFNHQRRGFKSLPQEGGKFTHGGWFCHLDEVVRGGKGFPSQVGYLNIGGNLPSHNFKPNPTIISTPKTTSHLENSPLQGLSFFFAIKAGFSSFVEEGCIETLPFVLMFLIFC